MLKYWQFLVPSQKIINFYISECYDVRESEDIKWLGSENGFYCDIVWKLVLREIRLTQCSELQRHSYIDNHDISHTGLGNLAVVQF